MSELTDFTDIAQGMRKIKYKPTIMQREPYKMCPRCEGKLVLRKRRSDGAPFYACENFFTSGCRYTEKTDI